jgi:RHS repeat-associated protein
MAVIATYAYDGIARRIAKATSAGTTSFFWIGFELAMEYDASGLVSRRHRGAGFAEVVSAQQRDFSDLDQDGSTTDYVPLAPLYDGAYDCVGVLDHTGAVAESYVHTYDGAVTITNATGTPITASALGWHQGYGRMYSDAESGLLYAVHRYYDAPVARFLSEDPLGPWFDPSSLGNGYAFAANHYHNSHDPLGLFPPSVHRDLARGRMVAHGYSAEFAALAADADAAVDQRQDPYHSIEHGQTSDRYGSPGEAQDAGNAYAKELMQGAVMLAGYALEDAGPLRRLWLKFALWKLGRIFHMREDEATHRWCDMSHEHTGTFWGWYWNWQLAWMHPWSGQEGREHDAMDLLSLVDIGTTEAARADDKVIAEFEARVAALATSRGMSPGAALRIVRTGR